MGENISTHLPARISQPIRHAHWLAAAMMSSSIQWPLGDFNVISFLLEYGDHLDAKHISQYGAKMSCSHSVTYGVDTKEVKKEFAS